MDRYNKQDTATLFTDGINADKNAGDYKKETFTLTSKSRLEIHFASGGGFALKLQLMPTSAENTATHHK